MEKINSEKRPVSIRERVNQRRINEKKEERHKNYYKNLSQELKDVILEVFKLDFEMFGYTHEEYFY